MKLSTAYGSGGLKIRGCFFIQAPQTDAPGQLPPNIVELFKDPSVQEAGIVYSREDGHQSSAVFQRFANDPDYKKPPEVSKEAQLTEDVVRAWFVSAGFNTPTRMYRLVNQYDPEREDPWWLVKTKHGLIEIGWRKRVISIDWSETPIQKIITEDDVTKSETMVHAWSVNKAIEYLISLSGAILVQFRDGA